MEIDTETYHRVQLPLALGYSATVHSLQGMTFDKDDFGVYDCISSEADYMDESLHNRNINGASYKRGSAYVALSRVRCIEQLYLLGRLTKNNFQIPKNDDIYKEIRRLRALDEDLKKYVHEERSARHD